MRPVCLITGAAGRLGEALCRDLAGTWDVVAVWRRTPPRVASQLMQPLPASGAGNVWAVQADLTRRDDVRRVVEVALARHGRIDAVVNAAADIAYHGRLCELSDADDAVERQMLLNCIAPLRLVSAVHQAAWKDDPDGNAEWNRCVVNVSSGAGLQVGPPNGQGYYAASKAALNILTMHLAGELAPYSVRANALCPGRFRDTRATEIVAGKVRALMEGEMTGEVTIGLG